MYAKFLNIAKMDEEKYKEGFNRGWRQLKIEDTAEAKRKLQEALGVNNRVMWGKYLNGIVEPKASAACKVEMIFAYYQIVDVWGK